MMVSKNEEPAQKYFPRYNSYNRIDTVDPKYQHKRRSKRHNIYVNTNIEEDKDIEELYVQFLMLFSLASNDGG